MKHIYNLRFWAIGGWFTWVAVGVAVVGVAAGGIAAHEAGKAGAAPRDAGQELQGLPYSMQLKEAKRYAGDQIQLGNLYAGDVADRTPQIAKVDRQSQEATANQALRLFPQFATAERLATTRQRRADAADFMSVAPTWAAALRGISPGFSSLEEIGGEAGSRSPLLARLNLGAINAGPGKIAYRLSDDAMRELDKGGELTDEEARNATQAARAAISDRGMIAGNPALAMEVLNRDAASRARLDARRAFAGQADQLFQQDQELARKFGLGTEQLNQSDLGSRAGAASAATDAVTRTVMPTFASRGGGSFAPLLGAFGAATSAGDVSNLMAQSPSIFQGVQAMQGLYNYGSDVANTNFNAAETRQINKANAIGAIGSGLTKTAGSAYTAGLQK